MTFKHGVGPLLRACTEGERQHVQRGGLWSVELWSLEVRPWVRVCGWGLGPAWLEGVSEGVSECRGGALGGGVGAGLGFCVEGGRLQGQRIRPRSPTGSLVPMWNVDRESAGCIPFRSSMPPSPWVSPRISPVPAGPLTVGGSCWVLELLPSPSHSSGVRVP